MGGILPLLTNGISLGGTPPNSYIDPLRDNGGQDVEPVSLIGWRSPGDSVDEEA